MRAPARRARVELRAASAPRWPRRSPRRSARRRRARRGRLRPRRVVEVLALARSPGPLCATSPVALGYTLPLAWRRRAPLAVAATGRGDAAHGPDADAGRQLFVPFAAVLVLRLRVRRLPRRPGRDRWARARRRRAAAIIATMDDRIAGRLRLPAADRRSSRGSPGRAVRARTRLARRAARDRGARSRRRARREAPRPCRRAPPDRARAARRRRALDQRDGRAGRRRAADPRSRPGARAGGARRGSSAPAARRSARCAACSACCSDAGEPAALRAAAHAAEIGELVTRARAAGPAGRARGRAASAAPCPAGLDLAAYRIVQEALTNALKHAGRAPTDVTIDWCRARARARDPRPRARPSAAAGGGGHGLVGMRERVRLYGGELEAGAGRRRRLARPRRAAAQRARELSPHERSAC